ncbi:hypothetical protein PM082_007231 [Marasmius tenuissimus]|nr:hypothetical protein PM082_007231 [Marasmius tenuissimus]
MRAGCRGSRRCQLVNVRSCRTGKPRSSVLRKGLRKSSATVLSVLSEGFTSFMNVKDVDLPEFRSERASALLHGLHGTAQ